MPADFSPRANFVKNFFAAGGIAAVTNDGFAQSSLPAGEAKTDLAALVAAFKETGAALVCLCGSDEAYAREAVTAAKALTEAGVSAVAEPGGSVRDEEVILAANEFNIAMIFTGMRQFRH